MEGRSFIGQENKQVTYIICTFYESEKANSYILEGSTGTRKYGSVLRAHQQAKGLTVAKYSVG
jgi:hypothetical protein